MNKKYKLLPVQVENLERTYAESFAKLNALNVLENQEMADKKHITDNEISFSADTSLLGALSITMRDYKEAKEKLANYEMLEQNNSDSIGLGSTFEVEMNYEGKVVKKTFTLVETRNYGDDSNLISINSTFAKGVIGAKQGDVVKYNVGERHFTGTIISIIKAKQKTL